MKPSGSGQNNKGASGHMRMGSPPNRVQNPTYHIPNN